MRLRPEANVRHPGFAHTASLKTTASNASTSRRGYFLTEALVYIGLLFLLLGVAYVAMDRSIDSSVALRRNADDITRALHAGERWRADVRSANTGVKLQNNSEVPILHLQHPNRQVDYRYEDGALYRRTESGPWSRVLDRVRSSSMQLDQRPNAIAWRWELELQPSAKGSVKPGRIRPLFTFLAVPPAQTTP